MSAAELAGLAAARLRETGREAGARLTVAELRDEVVPYDVARGELSLATKAEYDLALLGVLADPERSEVKGRKLRKAVTKELDAPEPGLGVLEDFGDVEVRVTPPAPEEGGGSGAGPAAAEATAGSAEATRDEEAAGPLVEHTECWRCREELPDRAGLRFCPWCGTDQTFRECADCGEELELAWDFCPICGTRVEEVVT